MELIKIKNKIINLDQVFSIFKYDDISTIRENRYLIYFTSSRYEQSFSEGAMFEEKENRDKIYDLLVEKLPVVIDFDEGE